MERHGGLAGRNDEIIGPQGLETERRPDFGIFVGEARADSVRLELQLIKVDDDVSHLRASKSTVADWGASANCPAPATGRTRRWAVGGRRPMKVVACLANLANDAGQKAAAVTAAFTSVRLAWSRAAGAEGGEE